MLTIDGLSKVYSSNGRQTVAIKSITLDVAEGEFCSVVGPSGCGKTTLLKCISGLLPRTAGEATFDGTVITEPLPGMAVVFQDYSRSLMPWLNITKNVDLPLRGTKSKAARSSIVEEALHAVGLQNFGSHYPWQLSGGMQQRAAIARALAFQPRVLLLDEPMASVDAQTRNELEDLILALQVEYKMTVLLVTHDIDESIYMADRVFVLGPSPTAVRRTLAVDLPRPRDQVATKALPEFAALRSEVYSLVTGARAQSHAQEDQHH